jgi:hypothetical protein
MWGAKDAGSDGSIPAFPKSAPRLMKAMSLFFLSINPVVRRYVRVRVRTIYE